MRKIMLFIDGTWLYRNISHLTTSYRQARNTTRYELDYGKLPKVLADEVIRQIEVNIEYDIVRTYIFASYPSNYDQRDEILVSRQIDFLDILVEEYHYEVVAFPLDFRGRRIRSSDRASDDLFIPKEKQVDVALATHVLYYAAVPHAYDIAILLAGDRDYIPVLQHVRRLAKRVAIASIKERCPSEFADPRDREGIKDFDIIWIDGLLDKLEQRFEARQIECQSEFHRGPRPVWSDIRLRRGQRFFCEACRVDAARQKQEAQREFVSSMQSVVAPDDEGYAVDELLGKRINGKIKNLKKGFGFIAGENNEDFFFHSSDLSDNFPFSKLQEGQDVTFLIDKRPGNGKAGAAKAVHLNNYSPMSEPATSL